MPTFPRVDFRQSVRVFLLSALMALGSHTLASPIQSALPPTAKKVPADWMLGAQPTAPKSSKHYVGKE